MGHSFDGRIGARAEVCRGNPGPASAVRIRWLARPIVQVLSRQLEGWLHTVIAEYCPGHRPVPVGNRNTGPTFTVLQYVEPFQVLAEPEFHPKWVEITVNAVLDGNGPGR